MYKRQGSQKLPIRLVPAITAELAQGSMPTGALRPIAAWVLHLRGHGAPVTDARADEVVALAEGELDEAVVRVLGWLGINDDQAAAETLRLAHELQ